MMQCLTFSSAFGAWRTSLDLEGPWHGQFQLWCRFAAVADPGCCCCQSCACEPTPLSTCYRWVLLGFCRSAAACREQMSRKNSLFLRNLKRCTSTGCLDGLHPQVMQQQRTSSWLLPARAAAIAASAVGTTVLDNFLCFCVGLCGSHSSMCCCHLLAVGVAEWLWPRPW